MATRVSTQDFTGEQVKQIIEDARKQIENEQKLIAQGINPREDEKSDSKRSKTCNILSSFFAHFSLYFLSNFCIYSILFIFSYYILKIPNILKVPNFKNLLKNLRHF